MISMRLKTILVIGALLVGMTGAVSAVPTAISPDSATMAQNNEAPSLSIDYDPTEPNTGEDIEFTTDATDPDGEIESYEWTIDGEAAWSGDRLVYSFENPGDHVVRVTVTDDDGAETTRSTVVSVQEDNERPSVSIGFEPETPDVGEQVQFVAFADDSDGEIESYDWVVDGEDGGSGESIAVTFNSTGDHLVVLTVTDDDGAETRATATVTVERDSPVVSVDYEPTNPEVGEWVEFDADASHPNGDVQEIEWTVDGVYIDDGPQFRYNFDDDGDHQVNVTARDYDGDETTKTIDLSVAEDNEPPTVSLQTDTATQTVGEDIEFTAATSDSDGDIESYEWTVEGEAAGGGPTLTASFEEPGNYQVAVTVTDDDGAEAAATVTISVEADNEPPSVSIRSESTNPAVGDDVQFTAEASDSDGDIDSYEWTVDGAPAGTGAELETTFDEPGDHQITVTITDDDGAESTSTLTLTIEESNDPPSASIHPEPGEPTVNETVEFSTNASDSDGNITSYEWTVDGESAGTGAELTTTFDEPGDHQITVTITDDDGAEAISTATLTVQPNNEGTTGDGNTGNEDGSSDGSGSDESSDGSGPDESSDGSGSDGSSNTDDGNGSNNSDGDSSLFAFGLIGLLLVAVVGGYVYVNNKESGSNEHGLGSE
jgi:plastocyanin